MAKKLFFKKMHGLGNDFILIDSQENPTLYTHGKLDLSKEELTLIANRNYGIGCDQIIIIEPSTHQYADFDYLIYNQDGSSAGYCGNGARCVVKYLLDKYHLPQPITLNTNGRLTSGILAGKSQITINMGQPDFNYKASGYTKEFNEYNNYSFLVNNQLINFGIVSMGNPHAIISLKNTASLNATDELAQIGKTLQNSDLFKDGVNVNFFVIDKPDQIQMRTYERGAGFTLSCGSGACATAGFAIAKNLCSSNVVVLTHGGKLNIHWDKVREIQMTGDAIYVFDGTISL